MNKAQEQESTKVNIYNFFTRNNIVRPVMRSKKKLLYLSLMTMMTRMRKRKPNL